jgi:hypothetical protein
MPPVNQKTEYDKTLILLTYFQVRHLEIGRLDQTYQEKKNRQRRH